MSGRPEPAEDAASTTRMGPGIPTWLGVVLGLGLLGAVISLYLPADWGSSDVDRYHLYALGFWGHLIHPVLPMEYPPLSVLPFALTLAGPGAWYPDVFAFWMGVVVLLGFLAFRYCTTPSQASAYLLYAATAGVGTVIFRYDAVPALLTAAALWLIQRRRFGGLYPLLAAATLLKLYPIVLLPVAAIAHLQARDATPTARSRVLAGVFACVGLIALGFGLAATVDPTHTAGAITYQLQRPDEVESVPATLVWVGSLIGIHASPDGTFGSLNLTSSASPAINALMAGLLLAGLAWVLRGQYRKRLTAGQAAMAAILVLLCTSRVLSAQYFIWLTPLVATVVGFEMRWFVLCVLTALVFPILWIPGLVVHGNAVSFSAVLLAAIAVRNVVLILLTVRFLAAPGADLGEIRRRSLPDPVSLRAHPVTA